MAGFKGDYLQDAKTGKFVKVTDRHSILSTLVAGEAEPADYYLYQTVFTPVLTSDAVIGDKVLNVDSTVGAVVGQAVTLYEGERMHQNILISSTANTITIASCIDYAYTTSALIEVGTWNMAVNGSITAQTFKIKAPTGRDIHIHTINCSILDSTAMDDGLFGGIAQLTKGMVWRFVNGFTKHLAVIVNNLGFWEIGFSSSYSDKAPAGQYGFRARRDIEGINGVIIMLENNAEFQVIIQDDLTDLDLVAVTINGHFVEIEV